MKLTYFDGRGRAEPIRLMLAAGGIEYEDVRVTFEEWPKIKDKTPLGKLPILELDDGTIIAESNAIGRLVAKRAGLYGAQGDEVQQARVDAAFGFVTDFVQAAVKLAYEKDEGAKKKIVTELETDIIPTFVSTAERLLQENGGKFLVGDKLSWGDVFLFDTLRSLTDPGDPFYEKYMGGALDKGKRTAALESAPGLRGLLQRVGEQPGIKKWLEERPGNDRQVF